MRSDESVRGELPLSGAVVPDNEQGRPVVAVLAAVPGSPAFEAHEDDVRAVWGVVAGLVEVSGRCGREAHRISAIGRAEAEHTAGLDAQPAHDTRTIG